MTATSLWRIFCNPKKKSRLVCCWNEWKPFFSALRLFRISAHVKYASTEKFDPVEKVRIIIIIIVKWLHFSFAPPKHKSSKWSALMWRCWRVELQPQDGNVSAETSQQPHRRELMQVPNRDEFCVKVSDCIKCWEREGEPQHGERTQTVTMAAVCRLKSFVQTVTGGCYQQLELSIWIFHLIPHPTRPTAPNIFPQLSPS